MHGTHNHDLRFLAAIFGSLPAQAIQTACIYLSVTLRLIPGSATCSMTALACVCWPVDVCVRSASDTVCIICMLRGIPPARATTCIGPCRPAPIARARSTSRPGRGRPAHATYAHMHAASTATPLPACPAFFLQLQPTPFLWPTKAWTTLHQVHQMHEQTSQPDTVSGPCPFSSTARPCCSQI